MGFFDDLAMGFGLKEKDQDYYDRTAATIERNQGSGAADSYRERTASARASAPGSSSGSSGGRNLDADMFAGSNYRTTRSPITNTDSSNDGAGRSPTSISAAQLSDPKFMATAQTRNIGGVNYTVAPPENRGLLANTYMGKAVSYLGGVRDTDPVVGSVDGKPIYQRENGTYYSYNALGLPYDTAGKDTLDEDPAQIAKRKRMMGGMGGGDDGPAAMPDIGEGGTGEEEFDPCPEGYKYDEEEKMCVVDVSFVPDLPDVEPTPLLPTEVGGNYTQMPGGVPALPPLQPYPQALGLGATNLGPKSEGILQVVAGPQAPRGPAPIPSLTMPQMPPQRRA